jgi:riboflavin biosynthesis pyrimidine reductase
MWNGLLAKGLVDELHLMVGPAALGGGTPIFGQPMSGRLIEARRFDGSENVLLRYEVA